MHSRYHIYAYVRTNILFIYLITLLIYIYLHMILFIALIHYEDGSPIDV
jgi:hypothetical protein